MSKVKNSHFALRATRDKQNLKVVILIFLLIGLYFIYKNITASVFLKQRDKVNLVFYGENIRFYSLDRKNVSYLLFFPNSLKVIVPGGYGDYKVGAVGKLVSLEKKPEIISRTFSAATSSLVDLYFYPKETTIFHQDSLSSDELPTFKEIFFTNSNANLIDRLFLFYFFTTNDREDYQTIDLKPFQSGLINGTFDDNAFYKQFQGSFFQKTYRNDDTNVQIIYTKSYKTALLISQMIEGEGIRVVDLSNQEKSLTGCLLTADKKIMATKTFQRLADFFKCRSELGETSVSDIILKLGDLEKDWAVN